jgi:hypothetical protein
MRWRYKKARLRALLRTVPIDMRYSLRRRKYMQTAVRAGFRPGDADKAYAGRMPRGLGRRLSAMQRRQARRCIFPCEACKAPVNLSRDDRCRWCGAMPFPF